MSCKVISVVLLKFLIRKCIPIDVFQPKNALRSVCYLREKLRPPYCLQKRDNSNKSRNINPTINIGKTLDLETNKIRAKLQA